MAGDFSPLSCYFCHAAPPRQVASPAQEPVLVAQLGCNFCNGWHLPRGFLNLIHSGLHNSQGHVFLCLLGPSAALASHNILPSRVTQTLGSGGPLTNVPCYTETCVALPCVCSRAPEVGLPCSPSCFSRGFFFVSSTGIQVQGVSHVKLSSPEVATQSLQ